MAVLRDECVSIIADIKRVGLNNFLMT
jgi:hypothetical protein